MYASEEISTASAGPSKINFPVAKNQHGSGVRGVAFFAALGEFVRAGERRIAIRYSAFPF